MSVISLSAVDVLSLSLLLLLWVNSASIIFLEVDLWGMSVGDGP